MIADIIIGIIGFFFVALLVYRVVMSIKHGSCCSCKGCNNPDIQTGCTGCSCKGCSVSCQKVKKP
ncbi:MAG TPA: FeoB-associated Cys-rich membrane protein [Clostridiales bacterium]|nr:FeoB-associated Cys-rich membrane protein [Clostridiales bacterium]